MPLLQSIPDSPGYLKATFQGPQGSGKTRTAAELAITTHKLFKSAKPIAFFDTETGSDFIAGLLEQNSGHKPLRVKTRAFSDLMAVVKECLDGAADVLIIDSITHVWREIGDAYLVKVNERLKYPKKRMDIQDIMQIKQLWQPWPDLFMKCPMHIIVCGREGNEWGNEEDEETGKSKLVQTGKKMKVEAEFGYEANLQIAMSIRQEAEQTVRRRGGHKQKTPRTILNIATVLKDRFDEINGQMCEMPTGEFFLPHLNRLNPSAHVATDTSVKTDRMLGDVSDSGFALERHKRVCLAEEIQAEIVRNYPGMSARDKACKAEVLDRAFGTRSWTRIESMDSQTLQAGLVRIREMLADRAGFESLMDGAKGNAGKAEPENNF